MAEVSRRVFSEKQTPHRRLLSAFREEVIGILRPIREFTLRILVFSHSGAYNAIASILSVGGVKQV
jgi:hypothetical protein